VAVDFEVLLGGYFRDFNQRGKAMLSRCLIVLLFPIPLMISGCVASQKTAWDHYDECATETSSFRTMADCGKQRRLAYCQDNRNCGDIGNSVVQYADALSQSVANREMTEAEARRRFIEFKTTQAQVMRQQQLQAAAVRAASGPVFCNTVGNSTICN